MIFVIVWKTSIKIPTDVKLYKDQNKCILFSENQSVIKFTNHDCHSTTFRRLLVAKEFTKTQLILLEAYRCHITA